MVVCAECEKKLGMFEGYQHPVLGTRFLVCGSCFDKVIGDMERWSRFCLSPSFSKDAHLLEIQEAWNTTISEEPLLQKWFVDLWKRIRVQDLQQAQKKGGAMRALFQAFH
jgi:hypothetical protein